MGGRIAIEQDGFVLGKDRASGVVKVIDSILDRLGEPRAYLCRKTAYPSQYFTDWAAATKTMSSIHVTRICAALGVPEHTLTIGAFPEHLPLHLDVVRRKGA